MARRHPRKYLLTLYHSPGFKLRSESEQDMKSLTIGRLAKEAGVNLETVSFLRAQGLAANTAAQCLWLSAVSRRRCAPIEIHPACSRTWVLAERNRRTAVAPGVAQNNERSYSRTG